MRMAFLLEMLLLTCAQVIANSYQSLDHSIPVELYVFALQIKFNKYVDFDEVERRNSGIPG